MPTADTARRRTRWQYVDVEATVLASSFVAPKAIVWPDGRRFEIDRVTSCRYSKPYTTWHYEIEVRGRPKQLWMRGGAFFVLVEEGGSPEGAAPPAHDLRELRKRYGYRP